MIYDSSTGQIIKSNFPPYAGHSPEAPGSGHPGPDHAERPETLCCAFSGAPQLGRHRPSVTVTFSAIERSSKIAMTRHADSALQPGTVLIADENEIWRRGLAELLSQALGITDTLQAGCYARALSHAATPGLALAIVDPVLPGMPGPRGLTELRRACPAAKLVALSSSARRSDMLDALTAGVHGYLLKTSDAAALVTQLELVLGGTVHIPPSLADIDRLPGDQPPVAHGSNGSLLSRCTPRQIEVLRCIGRGMANKEIAEQLQVSPRTVKMHVSALFRILGVRNRTQAATCAQQLGFVGPRSRQR